MRITVISIFVISLVAGLIYWQGSYTSPDTSNEGSVKENNQKPLYVAGLRIPRDHIKTITLSDSDVEMVKIDGQGSDSVRRFIAEENQNVNFIYLANESLFPQVGSKVKLLRQRAKLLLEPNNAKLQILLGEDVVFSCKFRVFDDSVLPKDLQAGKLEEQPCQTVLQPTDAPCEAPIICENLVFVPESLVVPATLPRNKALIDFFRKKAASRPVLIFGDKDYYSLAVSLVKEYEIVNPGTSMSEPLSSR